MATTRKPTADAKKAETERGDPMAALQSAGLDSLSWFGAPMLENMSSMGSEMLQFFADRIKEDMKTQHEILHCKTPREMLEVQTKFFQKAIDQYSAETGKLVEMGNLINGDTSQKKN